jgi:hypothetical protein
MITKIDALPYIGEKVKDVLAKIEHKYRNYEVRVVPHGMVITLEHDANRVTVWTDSNDNVSDITSG